VLLATGWTTIALAALLVVVGVVVGTGGGGAMVGPTAASLSFMALARIAPWPLLAPLAVVLLVVAGPAVAGRGWARAIAVGIAIAFAGFGLLGAGWAIGGSGGLVLLGKLVWVGANAYVVAALLGGLPEPPAAPREPSAPSSSDAGE